MRRESEAQVSVLTARNVKLYNEIDKWYNKRKEIQNKRDDLEMIGSKLRKEKLELEEKQSREKKELEERLKEKEEKMNRIKIEKQREFEKAMRREEKNISLNIYLHS